MCKELGFGRRSEAVTRSGFGASELDILLDNVMCTGDEGSLERCGHNGWGIHSTCSVREHAGVKCDLSYDMGAFII